MNHQQMSTFLSKNMDMIPQEVEMYQAHGVHNADSRSISSKAYDKPQKTIEKKPTSPKRESKRVVDRVKKQVDSNIISILQLQLKNIQRIADESLRRIHENELKEKELEQIFYQKITDMNSEIIKNNSEFRSAIETLARYSIKARSDLKEHENVIKDFESLVENYSNDTFEEYLNDRSLKKFNILADQVLKETALSEEEIEEIAKSLGMDHQCEGWI